MSEKPERDIDIIKGYINRLESQESTISQQAEIIKILKEACEEISGLMIIDSAGSSAMEVVAREALAQVEKLKGEVR